VYDLICLSWGSIFAYWYNIESPYLKEWACLHHITPDAPAQKRYVPQRLQKVLHILTNPVTILACTPALYMLEHAAAMIPASAFRNHVRRASWTPTSFS
jgi:hypothetical protein